MMKRRRSRTHGCAWPLVCGVVIALVLSGSSLTAQTSEPKLSKKKELSLLLVGGGLLGASLLADPSHSCPCEPDSVNGLDRRFAGDSLRSGTAKVSDTFLYGVVPVAAVSLAALDGGRRGLPNRGLVVAEAWLIDTGLTNVVKRTVARPRPFVYGLPAGTQALQEDASYASFFSGHSSMTFAVGFAAARSFAPGQSRKRTFVRYAVATGLAATTGALRVAARKHFPSDVLAGAAAGATVGLYTARVH